MKKLGMVTILAIALVSFTACGDRSSNKKAGASSAENISESFDAEREPETAALNQKGTAQTTEAPEGPSIPETEESRSQAVADMARKQNADVQTTEATKEPRVPELEESSGPTLAPATKPIDRNTVTVPEEPQTEEPQTEGPAVIQDGPNAPDLEAGCINDGLFY